MHHQSKNNEDDGNVVIHAAARGGNGVYRVARVVPAAREVVCEDDSDSRDGGIVPIAVRWLPTGNRRYADATGHDGLCDRHVEHLRPALSIHDFPGTGLRAIDASLRAYLII